MNYWNTVKEIQIKLKNALIIPTGPATEIIDGITSKHGYIFRADNSIYAVSPNGGLCRMESHEVSRNADRLTKLLVLLDKETDEYIKRNS